MEGREIEETQESIIPESEESQVEEQPTATEEEVVPRASARQRNPINYKLWHTQGRKQFAMIRKRKSEGLKKFKISINDTMRHVMATIMMNVSKQSSDHGDMTVKQGIKMYGKEVVQSVLKEYSLIDEKTVFKAVNPRLLTTQQKVDALNLITFMKLKRSGKLKTRACADGRKQRKYISKEEVSSPTVQLESLLLSLLIDASENRSVATTDIVGAYLMAKMDD